MGDVIQKGQPQKVGRKMMQCRRKFEDLTIFAKDLKTHLNMLIPQGNSKEELNQRQEIISQVYRKWTEENPDKRVYNRSLKDYINVRCLSITETMRHAAKTYTSTLALLQLDTILRYSVVYGKPKPPKKGVSNQKAFAYYAGSALRFDWHRSGENDGRSEADRREGAILHYCDKSIKKEIDRLARSKGHHQILDV